MTGNRSKRNIYIGVDGGGTKTAAAAIDDAGRLIARSTGQGMNYNFRPIEEAAANLLEVIDRLGIQDGEVRAVCVGDPSIDDAMPAPGNKIFEEALSRRFHGAEQYFVSDAFATLYGAVGDGAGILIISGTGSMGVGTDGAGKVLNSGGWGLPTNDGGSAYAIAAEAVSRVYGSDDGLESCDDILRQAVLMHFKATDARELCRVINGENLSRAEIAALASKVTDCEKGGSVTARGILEAAARELYGLVVSLADRLGGAGRVNIYGGVLTNSVFVRERFCALVTEKYPRCAIGFPAEPPEIGAARFAKIRTEKEGGKNE